MNWSELHHKLRQPFAIGDVSFRPGQTSHNSERAQALPYAEPRVYEDRLNEVLGADWSCRFRPWGEKRLLCELSVRVHDNVGGVREITRTSTGEWGSGDKIAQGTSAEAQAFKRACSKFGLGRHLYDVPAVWVGYNKDSRRLTETPALPRAFHPQPEPLKLTKGRASSFHRELGKLQTIASSEHHALATEALGETVDSFTDLTDEQALVVLNHIKRVDRERQAKRHINPERQSNEERMRA